MNVLILTPDGVGSTVLQRVLTVFMSMSNFDKNVINLHELSNGLDEYFSTTFNQTIVSRAEQNNYSQSLEEIQQMLERNDHYKTSRLAHYHLLRRRDPIDQQAKFYNYLSDNFFVIAAQRKSVFEYGLNWGLKSTTNKLNVYSTEERLDQMYSLRNQVTIDPLAFENHLNRYKNYLNWVADYWNPNSFFIYEDHVHQIEEYVHSLDLFTNKSTTGWNELSGITWQEWNRCHKLFSDALVAGKSTQLLIADQSKTTQLAEIQKRLPIAEQDFLNNNLKNYTLGQLRLQDLVRERVLPTNIPIKMQTLAEKKMLIKNFAELIDVYNEWASQNGFDLIDYAGLVQQSNDELSKWYTNDTVKLLN